jgi:hypothetical protein
MSVETILARLSTKANRKPLTNRYGGEVRQDLSCCTPSAAKTEQRRERIVSALLSTKSMAFDVAATIGLSVGGGVLAKSVGAENLANVASIGLPIAYEAVAMGIRYTALTISARYTHERGHHPLHGTAQSEATCRDLRAQQLI